LSVLRLKAITRNEWRLWRALRLAALSEAPAAFGSTLAEWSGAGDSETRWKERLSITGARDLIAFSDEEPVAMLTGVPDQDDATRVWLISMWVAPHARRNNLGRRLVDDIVEWANQTGRASVNLMVRVNNDSAILLYRSCGFIETGYQETEIDSDGVSWTELEMTRLL
jgi:ribosomal protein S18 acetylase RimI-like enzyme